MVESLIIYVKRRLDAGRAVADAVAATIPENPSLQSSTNKHPNPPTQSSSSSQPPALLTPPTVLIPVLSRGALGAVACHGFHAEILSYSAMRYEDP